MTMDLLVVVALANRYPFCAHEGQVISYWRGRVFADASSSMSHLSITEMSLLPVVFFAVILKGGTSGPETKMPQYALQSNTH